MLIKWLFLTAKCGHNCGQKVSPIPAPSFHQNEKILGNTRFPRICVGGDKRDRTADLLNAIQALSQLSYTPIFAAFQSACVLYQYSCGLSRGFYKKCKKSFRGVFKVEDGGRTVGVIPYDARTLPGAVHPLPNRERVRREKDDRPGGRSLRGGGGGADGQGPSLRGAE